MAIKRITTETENLDCVFGRFYEVHASLYKALKPLTKRSIVDVHTMEMRGPYRVYIRLYDPHRMELFLECKYSGSIIFTWFTFYNAISEESFIDLVNKINQGDL